MKYFNTIFNILEYYLSIIYGVAEHWVNLRINFFNFNYKNDIPSDNADTSNEKEETLALSLWY